MAIITFIIWTTHDRMKGNLNLDRGMIGLVAVATDSGTVLIWEALQYIWYNMI